VNLVVALHATVTACLRIAIAARLAIDAVVHVEGVGTRLASAGIVYGDARDGRLDAMFNVNGDASA